MALPPASPQAFDTGQYSHMKTFEPVILPVDARVEVNGMLPQEILVFKSKMLPIGPRPARPPPMAGPSCTAASADRQSRHVALCLGSVALVPRD